MGVLRRFSFAQTFEPFRAFNSPSKRSWSYNFPIQFQDEAYTLFYANSNWYYFVRLHAILCERLRTMYDRTQIMSSEEEKYKTTRRESAAIALRLKPQNEYEIPEYYPAFLEMLKSLLDGNMDATTYEDKLRDMYGIHAYIAFTLDRVSGSLLITSRNEIIKLHHSRLFRTLFVSYNSVSPSAMHSSALNCINWRVGIMRPADCVRPPPNEQQPSWHISDEPSRVCKRRCTSKCLS